MWCLRRRAFWISYQFVPLNWYIPVRFDTFPFAFGPTKHFTWKDGISWLMENQVWKFIRRRSRQKEIDWRQQKTPGIWWISSVEEAWEVAFCSALVKKGLFCLDNQTFLVLSIIWSSKSSRQDRITCTVEKNLSRTTEVGESCGSQASYVQEFPQTNSASPVTELTQVFHSEN